MTFAVVASAAYMVVACMAAAFVVVAYMTAAFVVAAYTSDPVVERNLALDQDYNNLGPYLSSLYY